MIENNITVNSNSITTNTIDKNSLNIVYAQKGDPSYAKNMDYDEDDTITFDEFRQYCKKSYLNTQEMKKFLEIKNEKEDYSKKEESNSLYYKKDDDLDENANTDNNEKITFDKYINYCVKNAVSENENKLANAYFLKKEPEHKIRVEKEA